MSHRHPPRSRAARALVVGLLATSLTVLGAGVAVAEPGFSALTALPNPVGSSSPPDAPYAALSCPTTTSCTAVGPFGHISGEGHPSVVSETDGTWGAAAAISLPAGGASGGENPAQLNDVSCWSAGNCVAVGLYPLTNGAQAPLIATETSGTWSAGTTIGAPAGAATGKNLYASLESVWCDASGNCVASGQYQDANGKDHLMIAQDSTGTWSPTVELTDSSEMKAASFVIVVTDSIACTDVSDCTVASSVESNSLQSLRWTETSGTWSGPAAFVSANKSTSVIESITCPTTSFCVAVGTIGQGSGAAVDTETAGVWAPLKELPFPLLSPATNGGGLISVSCSSGTECVAVGELTEVGKLALGEPVATTYLNGTWSSLEPLGNPKVGSVVGDDSAMVGVVCLPSAPCVGLGGAGVRPYKSANEPLYSFTVSINPDVTPVVPGAPSGTTFKLASGKAVATWSAPQKNGGAPITLFTVTAKSAKEPTRTCTSTALSCTLKSLAAKHKYTVTVVARNTVGNSAASPGASFVAL